MRKLLAVILSLSTFVQAGGIEAVKGIELGGNISNVPNIAQYEEDTDPKWGIQRYKLLSEGTSHWPMIVILAVDGKVAEVQFEDYGLNNEPAEVEVLLATITAGKGDPISDDQKDNERKIIFSSEGDVVNAVEVDYCRPCYSAGENYLFEKYSTQAIEDEKAAIKEKRGY